nr:molybdopterin molybdotransferase MoeA [Candidatus Bathyarchaeota archaeon]NIR16239.1 molybdopterin molybdotransferase MoeA [Desulfobacterales bacterium]NIU81184.1 molybdopterin biosynthesis protein [Candidatus Bathyarchaeota archaeon]NIV67823.1 molybdopterin biosynthesis protein [Candidatus Bathyarchaeota archaeon]
MFRKLNSLEKAREILKQNLSPKPVIESIPLSEAHSRVLAEEIVASMNVPPFNRSTVDGYAVKADDTFGAEEDDPVGLKFCGHIAIGQAPSITVTDRTAAEIVTGAPLPQGADAVVMIEYTTRKDDAVLVHRPVSKGENVMKGGSDIQEGEAILGRGQTLSSREIGVLAALGRAQVAVYKRPKVAVISTGAELVEPGKPLPSRKIYDINAFTLAAAVQEGGGEPINLGVTPDQRNHLRNTLQKALDLADVIITSGGVSVGPKDIIPGVVDTLGKPGVIVSGIRVKPGKPTTIAMIDGKPVFSLPGHPTSALLMFFQLVLPYLYRLAGRGEETASRVKAVAGKRMFPARGRRTFTMV